MTNWRALPESEGELLVPVHPVDVPGVPVSWRLVHVLRFWMALMLVAFDGTMDEVPVTFTAMSLMHEALPLPQDFTCRVWPPVPEEAVVFKTVPLTMVVELELSSEKPMEETAWPLQLPCDAETAKGDVTEAPFRGADTLGPELLAAGAAAVLTVTGTSATQEAPDAPHDLTWMV